MPKSIARGWANSIAFFCRSDIVALVRIEMMGVQHHFIRLLFPIKPIAAHPEVLLVV
jgi:hypothetical protein